LFCGEEKLRVLFELKLKRKTMFKGNNNKEFQFLGGDGNLDNELLFSL